MPENQNAAWTAFGKQASSAMRVLDEGEQEAYAEHLRDLSVYIDGLARYLHEHASITQRQHDAMREASAELLKYAAHTQP